MTAEPAVDVDDLAVTLGGASVLDGVSTTVRAGRLVGLVGPNGAGKTTLLRAIRGGLDPDRGAVRLCGRRVDALDSRTASRLVATVPQSTAVTFDFTVRELVAMGRTPHVGRLETRTETDRQAVEDAMVRAGVTDLADRPVTDVSGGERQRVFLARALAQDTPVLLLDEPTSDLDVNHQVRALELVRDLADDGRTVVAAIHDLDLAARYCDELRLLHEGRVRAAGPPDDVLTDESVTDTFDTAATVARHPVTGTASVTAFPDVGTGTDPETDAPRVHVVGGGDAATPLLHRLDAAGFELSVGTVAAGSADARTARRLGAEAVTVPPNVPVGADTRTEVEDRIRTADVTVVADMDLGPDSLPTLRAAADAGPPVVVDGRPLDERNHAGADGRRVDATLRERGTVVDAVDVVSAVRRRVSAGPVDAGDIRR
jgi:iron complex transport system ATP-binding protein